MKKSRFTEEKMVKILREADRIPVQEVAKRHGISDQTIYGWRKRFGQLEAVDVRRLRQLEQENSKLKKPRIGALLASNGAPCPGGSLRNGRYPTSNARLFRLSAPLPVAPADLPDQTRKAE